MGQRTNDYILLAVRVATLVRRALEEVCTVQLNTRGAESCVCRDYCNTLLVTVRLYTLPLLFYQSTAAIAGN